MQGLARQTLSSCTTQRRALVTIAGLCCTLLLISPHAPGQAQQEPDGLEVLLGDVSLNKLPFVIAYEEGIYAKNGLNVKPMFSQGSVDIIRRSGVDVADEFIHRSESEPPIKIGGAAPTIVRLTTRAGAWDPVILGSTHRTSRWRIVVRPGIDSVNDLRGKRIGYSGIGAITHFMAICFAEHLGWDPNLDWSMLGGGLGVDALQNGHVDAFVGPELHATMAVDAGFNLLVDLGDYKLPNAGSSFLFDRDWLARNPDTAKRFIKSTVEALALLKNDKQAAFRTLRKWYRMTDPDLLEFFYLEVEKLPRKPYPPYAGLEKVMEVYDSHEMRKYSVEHFYDDTFVKELDESGYIESLYD